MEPGNLSLSHDSNGKPCLINSYGPSLRFNLSHSAGVAVFAVAQGREVGIDVEYVRRDFPVEAVAETVFSPVERQGLRALCVERRVDAFFASWTRKEAYLKGVGVGWGTFKSGPQLPLDPLDLMEPSALEYHPEQRGRGQWAVAAFDAGTGFAAALAVEGEDVKVPEVAQTIAACLG
jgi:4'-phosphopantetheinyl transferase